MNHIDSDAAFQGSRRFLFKCFDQMVLYAIENIRLHRLGVAGLWLFYTGCSMTDSHWSRDMGAD